jgi:hypothetical protein
VALTAEDAVTATMTKVVGHVEVSPGDRLSYRALIRVIGVVKLLEDVIAWDGKSWEMP